ncbi:HNH endonuclease signature motif containing protein [Bacillus mycoides]|uniref:HNH endonuclease signature motif containing protein n=1 Tax=Bacillus mycoides TaxID=1405 RepID=UPI001C00B18D|nr:HNH endonuclease signature motif containing protein [Bacillus mycoides]
MSKSPEESIGTPRNALLRYYSVVHGSYIEQDIDIKREWKTSEWGTVKRYFKEECIYCGEIETEEQQHQKEHLHSIVDGGLDIKANVLPACKNCNKQKGRRSDWKEFMREKAGEKAEKRIKKVQKYRIEECKWDEVKEHQLFTNKVLFDIRTEKLEEHILRWATIELYGKELNRYIYHITTEQKWKDAKKKNKFPAKPSCQDVEIKCSYENLLTGVLEKVNPNYVPGENYVILSFEVETLERLNIPLELHMFLGQAFQHIKGQIEIDKVEISSSHLFQLDEDIGKLKGALKSIPHSLTKRYGIRNFLGFDPQNNNWE